MKVKELYKKWHPEQFSDSIIIDKISCPKDFLSYHIENLSKSNDHFAFEEFCKKLIERTICPNLIEETGPAAGGDGKVDTENYPVSTILQEKWYFGLNPHNERWAFAISLERDWKEKCNKDIQKIIGTNRGYSKIFFISGQAIKNNLRLKYQDSKTKLTNIEIYILDKTWIIDKALNPYNLDLLSIIKIETKVKEVITGKNDYAKKLKLEKIESKIKSSDITQETLSLAIEAARLSRELEFDSELVLGKYDRAKRYSHKLNNVFQTNNIFYEMAWYSYWWLEDYKLFSENYNLYESNTKDNICIEETTKLNNLYMLTIPIKENELISNNKQSELLRRISLLEKSVNKCVSLTAQTLRCFINITKNFEVSYQFEKLNIILDEAKTHKGYDLDTTAHCIEKLCDMFLEDEMFNVLFDKVTEMLSTRKKDVEKGSMLYKKADCLFNNGKYQEAILYYSQCLTLFYKNETSYKLFITYCHMGICFRMLGMNYGAKNYFIAAIHHTLNEYISHNIIEPISDVIVEEIIHIELENGNIEYALKWTEFKNYIKSIISQHNLKLYDENKETEKDLQIQSLFSMSLLQTKPNKYQYLASLNDYINSCQLDIISLTLDYITNTIDETYLKEINMTNDSLDEFMKSLYFKCVEYNISQPLYLDNQSASLYTKISGSKVEVNFKNNEKTMLFVDLILSYIENCTIGFWAGKLYPKCEVKIDVIYVESENFMLKYMCDGINRFEIKISFDYTNIYENQSKIKDFIFQFISQYITIGFMCSDYKKVLSELFFDGIVFERSFNHTNCIYNLIDIFGELKIEKKDNPVKRDGPIFTTTLQNEIDFLNIPNAERLKNQKTDFKNISHKNIYSNQLINIPLWDLAKWNGMLYLREPSYNKMLIGLVYENEPAGTKIFDELIKKYGHEDANGEIMISFVKGIDKYNIYDYRVAISGKVNIPQTINDKILINQTSRFHHMNCKSDQNIKILEDYISKKSVNNIYILPAFNNGNKIDFDRKIKIRNIKIMNAYELKLTDFEHIVLTPDCNIIIPKEFDTTELDKIITQNNKD